MNEAVVGELTVRDQRHDLSPVMKPDYAVQEKQEFDQFVRSLLVKDVDFGVIPGTPKPTMLKPGAEKICRYYGLFPSYDLVDKVENWIGDANTGGEPLFAYRYLCKLTTAAGLEVGSLEGSANSWESRFRYRNADLACPECGAAAIIKGKAEYGGGWICFAKRGGCGAKFTDMDPMIINQPRGKVPNPDIYSVVNTLQKRAQKRAFVGAVLMVCAASDRFTHDVEDLPPDQVQEEPTPRMGLPITAKVETKKTKDIRAARAKMVEWFRTQGVTPEEICAACGRDWIDHLDAADITRLREFASDVKAGKKAISDMFSREAEVAEVVEEPQDPIPDPKTPIELPVNHKAKSKPVAGNEERFASRLARLAEIAGVTQTGIETLLDSPITEWDDSVVEYLDGSIAMLERGVELPEVFGPGNEEIVTGIPSVG